MDTKTGIKAIATTLVLALTLSIAMIPSAYAMQNIKCVVMKADKNIMEWSATADRTKNAFSQGKLNEGDLRQQLTLLAEQGVELESVCKECGAKQASAMVGEINETLSAFAAEPMASDEQGPVIEILEKIAQLPREFDL